MVIDTSSGFDPWTLLPFYPELSALTVVRAPAPDLAGEAAASLARAGAGFILLMGEVPEHWLGPLWSRSQPLWDSFGGSGRRLWAGVRTRLEPERRFFADRLDLGARAAGWASRFGALREKPRGASAWRDGAGDPLPTRAHNHCPTLRSTSPKCLCFAWNGSSASICCGLTGHLELARRRDLYGSPVVVGLWEEHVVALSEEVLPFGVVPGMALRQAEHLCPQATFLPPDPEAATHLRELISSALYDVAPTVEVRVEGVAWLDVSGVVSAGESIREARRRLRAAIGREPRLGLAPGPFSARLAAVRARPGRLVQVDEGTRVPRSAFVSRAPARRGAAGTPGPPGSSHAWRRGGDRPARAGEPARPRGTACGLARARSRAGPAHAVAPASVHERASPVRPGGRRPRGVAVRLARALRRPRR